MDERKTCCPCVILLACIILQAMPVMAATGTTEVSGTVPLVTYDISGANIGYHSVTISWKTNGNATSQVFYDTVSHDSIVNYAHYTDEDTSLVSEHSIALTGLSSGTTYHFRVRSVVDGIEATSSDYTFTTRTPAGPGPGPGSRYYLDTNFFGETSKWRISSSGRLLEAVDITSKDGEINIHIPKNTYCLDEKGKKLKGITIVEEKAPETPEGYVLLGKAYDLGPDSATFKPYLRLTLAYEDGDVPEGVEEENLYITYYDNGWIPLDAVVNIEENKVSANITHFTNFAIMAKLSPPPPPAKFVLSNLNIIPTEVKPGEEVTITVEVANIGGREGSCTVSLLINNALEETKKVTLAPKAVKTVVFTVIREEPGSYSVAVDGLSGSFTVAVAPPTKPINWHLIGGVIAAVVAGLLIYFLAFRRRRQ